ncbi:fish-egg lectin-like [Salminus brasiliensis]|uniref:fish-egg lectin-like n=1 Tax=Salminus brasiliensis TaxID=930266 RepID=UPI003B832344
MKTLALVLVLLNLGLACLALQCSVVPGSLKQIDAGNGQVFGVNSKDEIFTLYSKGWVQVPGSLKHVSVGPAGVWGVDSDNYIFRLQRGDWTVFPGLLKQVDAGGVTSPAGVNMYDDIYCLPGDEGATWISLPGKLKYYSCGPYSCWGVNSADNIYIMKEVTQTSCGGSLKWEQIPGSLSMVEVSTDGKVYGVNSNGDMYEREGISSSSPSGTKWRQIQLRQRIKHISYDLGHLWLITSNDSIMDCTENQ